jgi:hypothetical protein
VIADVASRDALDPFRRSARLPEGVRRSTISCMKKRLRKIAMILVVIYILWKLISGLLPGGEPNAAGTEYLTNRVWVEKMPADAREQVRSLILIDRAKKMGATAYGSAYRFTLDVLGWRLDKDRLEMMFLQDEKKEQFTVRTWKCKGDAPDPFDLCLEMRGPGGTKRYYSGIDWEQIRKRLPFAAEEEKALEALAD